MKKFIVIVICCLALFSFIYFGLRETENSLDSRDISKHHRLRLFVTHKGGVGEHEMAERIKLSARKLGIECMSLSFNSNPVLKRLLPRYKDLLVGLFDPDIIISLQGDYLHYPKAKQYAALTHGSSYYFTASSPLPIQYLMAFQGFLISFPDQEKIADYCIHVNHPCHVIQWYSTCGETNFVPLNAFRLFYCGANLSSTSFGQKYTQLFSRLDKTDYLDVYGQKDQWLHTPNSYRGFIRSDGESILKVMRNSGITLILHAPDHLYGQTPNAKIFEACAASTIVITDRNLFLEKEFGDTLFFIDEDLSSEEIFQQIDDHIKWIKSHPEEAIAKAKKAHDIFTEKFTLEKQLENLVSLDQLLSDEPSTTFFLKNDIIPKDDLEKNHRKDLDESFADI